MSAILIDEYISSSIKSSYVRNIEKRRAEVAAIVADHSEKMFGHSNATISEIRMESLRKRLEAALINS